MAIDIKKLQAKARQTGRDFTKTTEGGGGGYQPPAAGPCNLRFVGYFEVGEHEKVYKDSTKRVRQVQLVFELSGKNHPLRDGAPLRMTITETDSSHAKANLPRLFKRMNYDGAATHFADLLGHAYRGRVHHREYEVNGAKRTYASLRNDDGYSITPPVMEMVDDEGNVTAKPVKIAEPLTALKLFLWDNPDMEQWASIYIEGEYPAYTGDSGKVIRPARSKNVIQEKIMSALNWQGSPMQILLEEGVLEDEVGEEAEEVEEVQEAPAVRKKAGALLSRRPAKPPTKKPAVTVGEDDLLADLDGDDIPF